ncbi:hypothetical protein MMAG44476_17682 [Mycolicibacterium mageritense DSM 44476 = CIP 104973]|uniref:Uncharacterized protein n=1 Tax=Mycolicibacterium mageritense TaxID=53462 RepID=A0AAI8XJX6_MYCME|nr:hypothetical protein [Mycolicibacterium mageritense]MCC9184232.1 hypothetical protein [Mycolicibacterium mageritense]CDO21894.1 hypothetical protein BN978_02358 [Mycolicibacterium mageritense DSM 44476 = CIP 104973]BBX33463.1 hypothetical protein MMAGJ_27450 [Mycolicibacterium mageritense]BDY27939.1 hypothetical protein hbim_01869 [Mycolicibacterium mageritense]GJJ24021.1 hypothetical protein MTY414_76950 [Mycolicibacterium mageritense]
MGTSNVSLTAAPGTEGGGAALDQVIGMSVAALVVTVALLWIGYLHRMRRITWLNNFAERLGRKFHRPPWVALQVFLFTATIICALFGFIWDVSLHIGKGRDAGPLANPAHYFILIGLFLLFIAGSMAIVLPYEKPGPAAIRITRTWYAPVGGVLMALCGLYALIGFPLDDIWHRIFGQDVTLWGPTHLMLIGGAGLSLIAVLLLEHEGRVAMGPDVPEDSKFNKFLYYLSFGGLFIGLSVFQIEYDFGVEQFRLVLQPMMIAGAAALAAVAARLVLGPGAALIAAGFAVALRGAVAFVVGPVLGAPTSWFALYLGPALVVELLALTPLVKRPIVFGAVAGLGVATAGLWLESLWIGAVYRFPWPTTMWPEALGMAVPVAVAMGVCGALLALVLTGRPLPRPAVGISVVVVTVLVIGGAVATGLRTEVPESASATVTLTDIPNDTGQRLASADVQITPANLISADPEWVSILAWQGGLANDRGLVVDRLERVGPGRYRSTQPIPVSGSWKTVLRVQDGTTMAGVPLFLPADAGIGAPETPALESGTRPFVQEITLLQRERNLNHPSWLFTVASLVVLVCTLILIAGLTWGAGRINARELAAGAKAGEPRPVQPQT